MLNFAIARRPLLYAYLLKKRKIYNFGKEEGGREQIYTPEEVMAVIRGLMKFGL